MDWFSWLSKAGLHPSLVYQYGVVFARNHLDHDDIPFFNHDFLLSIGVSVAKHRLQILKLAAKHPHNKNPNLSTLFVAIRRTKARFSDYLRRAWTRRGASLALVVPRSYNVERSDKFVINNKNGAPLLLTNGSPIVFASSRFDNFANPNLRDLGEKEEDDHDDEENDEYWSSAVEEIRWDTMFHNLKPT